MFKETPKEFFKEKSRALNEESMLKTETTPKTAETPKASIEEVQIVREKWSEITTLVEKLKPVSPELWKEASHLAHIAHKIVKNTNKQEAKEMKEIEDAIAIAMS